MCSDIPYNMTFYPNSLKHQSQREAEEDLKQFDMLVNVKCSEDMKFFLCTLYAPVCTMMDFALPPCRHLCLSAKNGCEALMVKFGYPWPDMFECSQFPENGMCVGENKTTSNSESSKKKLNQKKEKTLPELECPHVMKILSKSRFFLRVANRTVEQCSLPCSDDSIVPVFFEYKIRNQLRFWTGLSAVLSSIASGLTLITFLADLKRFEFPERSILQISLCTMIVSGIYVFGMIHEGGYSCSSSSVSKAPLVTQGMDNFICTLVAVIYYYFSTALYLWWLVLCFSWFLVTTLKWGEAPVRRVFSSYFHVFAWGSPLVLVVFVLVMNGVDGDMFSSVCSVGNLQPMILFNFVVLPQGLALGVGFIFFVIGLISIIRIRSYIKGRNLSKFSPPEDASEKLFRLMTRMTIFGLLFSIPAAFSVFSNFYQSSHLESWLTTWYSTRCLHAQRASFGFTQPRELCPLVAAPPQAVVGALETAEPDPILYFLKHLPFFVVGLACAIWALNGKTFASFRDCCDRQCHRGRSRVPTVDH
ncbi:hypothetical protein FO519_004526 [Halicephalobus sp. NKZ332]|nr:hypothetical protein FO519_004526 [Halicephalobus sp. NKZ332]